MRVKKKPSHKK